MRIIVFFIAAALVFTQAWADALFVTRTSARHVAFQKYPLEIIQPTSAMPGDTGGSNAWLRTYPGLEYDRKPAAIGGAWPFRWELTTAPSGMTINPNTGVITWPDPVEAGSPHAVTVKVTDWNGNTDSETYSLTVETNNFIFFDAAAPGGGNGTIGSPFNALSDVFASRDTTTWAENIAYFKAGTYNMDGVQLNNNDRLPLSNGDPAQWLAYPGEASKPIMDVENAWVAVDSGAAHDFYFQGFRCINMKQKITKGATGSRCLNVDAGGDYGTVRDNEFYDLPSGAGGSGTNAGPMRFSDPDGAYADYWAILDNESWFQRDNAYGLIVLYETNKMLIQGNLIYDNTGGGNALGPKEDAYYIFIRDNEIYDFAGKAIYHNGCNVGNIELSYNRLESSQVNIVDLPTVGSSYTASSCPGNGMGPTYSYRNTYVGRNGTGDYVQVRGGVDVPEGPLSFENDVIVTGKPTPTYPDNIWDRATTPPSNNMTKSNLLTGGTLNDIVDINGNLQPAYSEYLGTHGHQVTVQ